ncbi:MAG: TRAP transporter small permease [Betaproteobacteria bacterium]|nr:TRAP transporter small permease [Betaproteobacteria bacterium]
MKLSAAGDLALRTEKALSFIGLVCASIALIASLVMVVIGVVGRYVLGIAVLFVDEYVGYALVVMAFMALASTLSAEKHIKIDSVVHLLPAKAQKWLEAATAILGLGIALFVTVQTIERAIMTYRGGDVSVSPLETPLFLPQMFIPIGFVLLDITLVVYAGNKIRKALNGS